MNNLLEIEEVDFGNTSSRQFLLGLMSAFENRYQACADSYFKEITWKQYFTIICIRLCKENPTINEIARLMGSSHQNVKQLLLKLEKRGYITIIQDENDRRKQRIILTEDCKKFWKKYERGSERIIASIFEGIEEDQIMTTIQTIIKMQKNVNNLV